MKFGNTTIGGMSFGSVKVGGASLGSQLVYRSGPGPDPGDLSRYVSNGLVLHLDGIEKGNTSGLWESLVGNAYYTLGEASTEETKSILMSGSGVILGTNVPAVAYREGTIECVYEYLSSGAGIVVYAATNGIAFIKMETAACFGVASSINKWLCSSMPSSGVASINADRLFVNGANIGTSKTGEGWSYGAATCPIGGRTAGTNRYYSNVRIYSIRIYNRLLTEAEMLKNQKVDNARFELGLNI